MYGTKVPNFIGLWSTSLELLKFIGSYLPNLEIKIKLKINIGQYGKPNFRAKQACLNLQHKISSHHLVHINDTQLSSILLPIFLFIFTLLWTFFSIMVRLTDVQRGRAIALLMQDQRHQQVANYFGVNVSIVDRFVRRLKGHRAFSRPTAVWASTRDVATSRQDNPSGTFAESSSHCYRNCP